MDAAPCRTPVLTGWLGGPKTETMASLNEQELIEAGLASLANIFDLDPKQLMRNLVAARAINWAHDTYAHGAYSYATPETRKAQSTFASPEGGLIFFSGEALYRGWDMGTVEAALTNGLETARAILAAAQHDTYLNYETALLNSRVIRAAGAWPRVLS